MKTATIQLESLACPSCMQKIEAAVKSVQGVDANTVQVLFNSSKVGEEKRAQVAKGLVDKFKITPDKANETVAFAMGIAHLRLMNAQ